MTNPFEAPKQEKPDEDIEIDVSDFEAPASGIQEFTTEELDARHRALEQELAPERESEQAAVEAVAEGFFIKNPFLKKRFEKDPGAMERFKGGLRELIHRRSRTYVQEPKDLPSDPRFQEDLVKYSFAFEQEEEERLRSGRRSA